MSVRLTRERSGVRAPLLPLAIARKSLAAEAVEKILKKIKKEVDFFQEIVYDSFCSQEWRNWQTRTVQVRVVAIP